MKLGNFLRKITDKQSLIILGPTILSEYDLKFLNELDDNAPIIMIDGGLNHFERINKLKRNPTISIGDNDSNKTEYLLDVSLDTQKDYSDLTYALNKLSVAFTGKKLNITMLGFLGGRLDHELINLGEINNFLENISFKCEILMSNKVISTNKNHFSLNTHNSFSFLAFADRVLTIFGECKYKLSTPTKIKALSSLTLSNQGFGKVEIQTDGVFFIILNDFDS